MYRELKRSARSIVVVVPFPVLHAVFGPGSAHSSSSECRSAAPLAYYSAPCTYTHTPHDFMLLSQKQHAM